MTNFRLFHIERVLQTTISNLTKMAESYPNGKKNTEGKGEIAQFLLFPQCFQKACFPGASIGVIVWEWVIYHLVNQPLYMCIIFG